MSEATPPASSGSPVGDPEHLRLKRRVAQLEQHIVCHGLAVPAEPPLPPPPVPPVQRAEPSFVNPAQPAEPVPDVALFEQGAPSSALPSAPPAAPPADRTSTSGAERFVGTKIAAVVGALAVVAALVYFIRLAIDLGWFGQLGPMPKFIAGFAISFALIGAAEFAVRRWSREAAVGLYGAGVACLFATVAGGVFVLDLLNPYWGAVFTVAATAVGAGIAARSRSLTVGIIGLIGGYALPATVGVLTEPGIQGGAFLTAILVVTLAMVAMGPPSFVVLRSIAILGLVPTAALWASQSGIQGAQLAMAIGVWWLLCVGSCAVEALHWRSLGLNSTSLALASLLAGIGALVASVELGTQPALEDPLAHLTMALFGALCLCTWLFGRSASEHMKRLAETAILTAPALLGACAGILVIDGVLSSTEPRDLIALATLLVATLWLSLVGPAKLCELRLMAAAAAPLAITVWLVETNAPPLHGAFFALVSLLAIVGTCIADARRGRTGSSDGAAIVLATLALAGLPLAAHLADEVPVGIYEPFSYVPFVAIGMLAALLGAVAWLRRTQPDGADAASDVGVALLSIRNALTVAIPIPLALAAAELYLSGAMHTIGPQGILAASALVGLALVISCMGPAAYSAVRALALAGGAILLSAWMEHGHPHNDTLFAVGVTWWTAFIAASAIHTQRVGVQESDWFTVLAGTVCVSWLFAGNGQPLSPRLHEPLLYLPYLAAALLMVAGTLPSMRRVAHAGAMVALACAAGVIWFSGSLAEGGITGAIFISLGLSLALVLTAIGPPSYAWVRSAALAAVIVLGGVWANWYGSIFSRGVSAGMITTAAMIWWSLFMVSCAVEALRGRSARQNAATLVLVSALAPLQALAALDSSSVLTDPMSYLPLAVAAGLGMLIFQFRDMLYGQEERVDERTRETLESVSILVRSAITILPATLLIAVGVFLPTGGLALGAAGCASIMAVSRARLVGWVAIPVCVLSLLMALIASFIALVDRGGANIVLIDWPPSEVGTLTRQFLRVYIQSDQLGPTLGALALFYPLWRARERLGLPIACAVFGMLILTAVWMSAFGPWSGPISMSVLVAASIAAGLRQARWIPFTAILTAACFLSWLGGAVLPTLYEWGPATGRAPFTAGILTCTASCIALWAHRFFLRAERRPRMDAIAALVLVACMTLTLMVQRAESGLESQGQLALFMATTAIGSLALALAARVLNSAPMALASVVPPMPALALLAVTSVAVIFGSDVPQSFCGAGVLSASPLLPIAGFLVAAYLGRPLLMQSPYWPKSQAGFGEAMLLCGLATVIVSGGAFMGGSPPAELVISAIAIAGAGSIVWGFRKKLASFRWIGLALLGVLAVRLFLIEMRDTSTLFRVSVLFVTGLLLVGTSIAYTLFLAPKRKDG